MVETGLPGRPNTGTAPRRPKISGLPGRMAIFQKSSVMPSAPNASRTRSCSPTDAPPVVTSRSAPRAAATMVWSACASSGATPSSNGSPPQARTKAAKAGPFEETIWFGPMGSPGITTSSPVGRMATRGLRATDSHGTLAAAARPTSRGVITRPARKTTSPSRKSMPALRTCRPGFASFMVMRSPATSVSSWITTVSAPSGRGAPVKMRTHSPGFSVCG